MNEKKGIFTVPFLFSKCVKIPMVIMTRYYIFVKKRRIEMDKELTRTTLDNIKETVDEAIKALNRATEAIQDYSERESTCVMDDEFIATRLSNAIYEAKKARMVIIEHD